jgi:hypothetical protein
VQLTIGYPELKRKVKNKYVHNLILKDNRSFITAMADPTYVLKVKVNLR